MDRSISPPPTKRRKLSPNPHTQPSSPTYLPDDSILRVYSWNINGITPFLPHDQNQNPITNFFKSKTPSPTSSKGTNRVTSNTHSNNASLRDFLCRHHWPQILCLQEVKIAPSDLKTQNLVRAAVNPSKDDDTNEPRYEVFFTLPTDNHNARGPANNGKVYGVCTIIQSNFHSQHVTRVRDVDWDHEGRISIIEITYPPLSPSPSPSPNGPNTKQPKNLAIWNIYAVNGTTNIWRDETTGAIRGTRHDKKLETHKKMSRECLHLQSLGFEILIIGDLNVAPKAIDGHPNLRTHPQQHNHNRADFNAKFLDCTGEGLEGVDVFRTLYPTSKKYTYYPRNMPWGSSCDRVDLVIASASLVAGGAIVGCEIWGSVVERGLSDHVPISVDIRFGGELSGL